MFRHLSALTVLLLLAAPATAGVPGDETCADATLPYALNVALPHLPDAPGFEASTLQTEVQKLIERFYARHGRCPERQLQVNIAVAGDYEILDWLAQGLVDIALVPDVTLHLLSRDGIVVKEMDLSGYPVGGLLLPRLRPQPRSARLEGGRWQRRPDPRADFATFQEQIWQIARAEPGAGPAATAEYRVVLASHLSSPGFLAPVAGAGRYLDARLGTLAERERPAVRERFWQAFFDNARFAVDCDSLVRDSPPGSRSCWRLPDAEERAGTGPVEVLFPGEGVLRRLAGPSGDVGAAADAGSAGNAGDTDDAGGMASGLYREHLVIAAGAADHLFDSGTRDVKLALPAGAETLFAAGPPLPALAPLLDAEPAFGVRTFRFTVDEVFGLLRRHQATSGKHDLALVLPGGGVKAAYQSTVVDALYGQGYLKNFKAGPASGSAEPLDVQYVIGTSGGALLGFFVSQLDRNGPRGLSQILWRKRDGSFVASTDIFAWTDLLRYVSVIASFLVLCCLIALVSLPERSPLNPASTGQRMGVRRPLTLGVFLPVLLLAPLLVRYVSADSQQEHIPEIEGLIYAILAMIAMVTDQAMVRLDHEREAGAPWLPPVLPVAVGAVLVLLPLLPWGDSGMGRLLAGPLTFGPAFGVLAPLVLLGGLILPLRAGLPKGDRAIDGPRMGWRRPALHFVAVVGLALAVRQLPSAWLDVVKTPFFLAGFLLVLVCVGANFLLAARTGISERARRGVYWGALLVSSLLLVTLCWPEKVAETVPTWKGFGESFRAQTLDVTVGSFLLSIGLLILMLGGIAWVYASRRRYHLQLAEFLVPYFVVLVHAVAVYLVLVTVISLLPDWLSPLELTREFWLWLLATSLILGSLLLLAGLGLFGGRRPGRWHAVVGYLRRSFTFLSSHHPNGNLITRRFVRMAVWSVCCVTWWNLVVAPALYGNGPALGYLTSAADQFGKKAGLQGVPYRPTARFIAPANLLEKDGTRYFLFIPEGDKCPSIPNRPASGAKWYRYEASFGKPGATDSTRPCQLVSDPKFLRDVIFASGSPFPIFPAHRVKLDGVDRPLVDGGYSNNVPVDVALTVSASQVLIVDSTNPLGHESPPTLLSSSAGRLMWVRGKLVENLGRLPGFLFERSQQVDRLSRRDLFVVSLAPSRDEPAWPPLFDFRQQTVERLERVAGRDLSRRIGMVQSWGRPRFQLSVPVQGRREAAPSGDPARRGDRRSPAAARSH